MFRKAIALLLSVLMVCSLAACSSQDEGGSAVSTTDGSQAEASASSGEDSQAETEDIVTNLPKVDMTKWEYNVDDNVYYQLGISYCDTGFLHRGPNFLKKCLFSRRNPCI